MLRVSRATYPTKTPTVLIFQWTVFHRRRDSRGRSTGNEEKTQREIRSFGLSTVSRTLYAGNPTAMYTELLLIKGIVKRLVEKPHREPTTQSMKLHLAVWTAARKGVRCARFSAEIMTRPFQPNSRHDSVGPLIGERH